ncbi:hypothetical protein BX666DRAFT_1133281 [Dichotomocladium elegans]|nr:hypothetical protein BX666DRAFT_1133281 [Dichotomocladium elegans]
MPESNISLTAIYQAAQQPTQSLATRLQGTLAAIDQQSLDHLLKRILRQLRQPTDQWPLRRLFRCLDYLVNQIPSHRKRSQSLRKCLQATMEYLHNYNSSTDASPGAENDHGSSTLYAALHWIGTLISKSKPSEPYVADVDRAIPIMLSWLASAHGAVMVQLAVVRVLSLQGKYFAPDIIEHDGLYTLAVQMGRVPEAMLQGVCIEAAGPPSIRSIHSLCDGR